MHLKFKFDLIYLFQLLDNNICFFSVVALSYSRSSVNINNSTHFLNLQIL